MLLVVAWLTAAVLLWRARVPGTLGHPRLAPAAYFPRSELTRAARYSSGARLLYLLGVAAELVVLLLLSARRRRLARAFALGEIGSGVLLGVAASLLVALTTLPAGVAGLWWDRRYGLSKESYPSLLLGQAGGLLSQIVTVTIVLVIVMLLARRFPRGWWALVAPLLVLVGAVFVLVGALLAPLGSEPVRSRPVAAALRRLERREGVAGIRVRVDKVSAQTREVNGETTGLGPTTVVILSDTLFRSGLSDRAIEFVSAHELGHAARRHVWKGLAWALLFTLPLTYLLARVTRRFGGLQRAEVVPLALLGSFLLSLLALPLQNAVSRHYESEADWMALQATRDPAAGREAFRSFTRIDLTEPEPPLWSYLALDDHPTVMQRLAMTRAWEARNAPRAAPSRAGSGSPRATTTSTRSPPSHPRARA